MKSHILVIGLLAVSCLLFVAAQFRNDHDVDSVTLPVAEPVHKYDLLWVTPGTVGVHPSTASIGTFVGVAMDDADGAKRTTVKVLQRGYVELPFLTTTGVVQPGRKYELSDGAAIRQVTLVEFADGAKDKTVLTYVNFP